MEIGAGSPHPYRVPPRVLIVDAHPGFRAIARDLLSLRGYTVVGEAACRSSAIEAAERLRPDGILLDLRLGDDDGRDIAPELIRACPGTAILLVSAMYDDVGLVAGVSGFVPKWRLASADLGAYWPHG
jgi:DNA-binding NarL/FixJ family response regulator